MVCEVMLCFHVSIVLLFLFLLGNHRPQMFHFRHGLNHFVQLRAARFRFYSALLSLSVRGRVIFTGMIKKFCAVGQTERLLPSVSSCVQQRVEKGSVPSSLTTWRAAATPVRPATPASSPSCQVRTKETT